MKYESASQRLELEREQDKRDAEILEAHAIMRAYPELTYGEALRHACARLRNQKKG